MRSGVRNPRFYFHFLSYCYHGSMGHLKDREVASIEKKANSIRISVIESLIEAGSGHTAGPLGMADVFATLFFSVLRFDPSDPHTSSRDRLILSNGHICPVLYATMAHAGYFPVKELKTLRKFGSRLQGHPHREYLPGLETSSGPLGSGLSQALGMALAERIERPQSQTFFYCFMGDGELNCGQVWEALLLAGREQPHNLIAVVDRNGIQIDGFTRDIMPLEPLREKFEAHNWHVIDVDGHGIREIHAAFGEARSVFQPTLLIAHTVPGKGVPQFERDYRWHGAPPGKGPEDILTKDRQGVCALKQLRSLQGTIVSECE